MTAYTESMEQSATYWAPGANDGFGGVAFASPVVITCRWQDKQDLIKNGQGQEVASSATVYVDQALTPKGYLALGDQSATANPRSLASAYEVINVGASPSLDATETLYKAWV